MSNFVKYCSKIFDKCFVNLSVLMVVAIIDLIINLIIPIISGLFLNKLVFKPSINIILQYCALLVLCNIVDMFCLFLISRESTILQAKSVYKLNIEVLYKFTKIDLLYLQQQNIGYLSQQIYSDINIIVAFYTSIFRDFFTNFMMAMISFIILIKINHFIAIVVFIVLFIYIIIHFEFKKMVLIYQKKMSEDQANFFSRINNTILNVKAIKIFNNFKYFTTNIKTDYTNLKKSLLKSQQCNFCSIGLDKILMLVITICIYILGGIGIIQNKITIGFLTILFSYSNNLMGLIKYFSKLYQDYLNALISYKRIKNIMDMTEDSLGCMECKSIHDIKIRNLTYSYKKKNILKNINMNLKKNQINVIVGENGCGKSTLLNCIIGLYSNYKGDIFINDANLKNFNLYHFRDHFISYSEQNPFLLQDTIYKNICITKNYSIDDISNYLIKFNLISTRKEAPDFLFRNVNDFKSNLSGGECQKINIIRELLDLKDVLIFDEPTAFLDKSSKMFFIDTLQKLMTDHIVIVVTHDLELISGKNVCLMKIC